MSTEHITNSIVGHLQELVSIKQNLGTSISNKGLEINLMISDEVINFKAYEC